MGCNSLAVTKILYISFVILWNKAGQGLSKGLDVIEQKSFIDRICLLCTVNR